MLNALVIVAVLLMAYWNYYQGFFTAFVHLVLVVCCGAMAFALWEPISVGMLLGMMPRYAWTVGLVIPFAVMLFFSRLVIDRYVPGNVNFGQITNMIGGGLCGALSGVLSIGILVIGLWHMPLPTEAFGTRPYIVTSNGQVIVDTQRSDSLLIPVDQIAVSFFGSLSEGSLSSGHSLHEMKPELIRVAHEMRIRPENGSIAATKDTLSVTAHHVQPANVAGIADPFVSAFRAEKGGNPLGSDKHKIVVIDTEWKLGSKTFDRDSKLRVPPTQIRLVTHKNGQNKPVLHMPVAFSNLTDKTTNERKFTFVNKHEIAANSAEGDQSTTIAWVFIIPADHTEQFFVARHLRFALPDAATKVAANHGKELAAAIGSDVMPIDLAGKNGANQSKFKGVEVEITPDLPLHTSRNLADGLTFSNSNGVISGTSNPKPSTGNIQRNSRVQSLEEYPGEAIVRVKLGREEANTFYSKAIQLGLDINGIFIKDNGDTIIYPIGYVVEKPNRGMEISINRLQPIRSVSQLPIASDKLATGEIVYLYFVAKRGVRLMSLDVGSEQIKDLKSMDVPKKP